MFVNHPQFGQRPCTAAPNNESARCVTRQVLNGATLAWLGCLLTMSLAHAQATDEAATLKKLSIEELLDIEVTSVSKRPEKLSETASAIQVITQDDIRRSGATSLPEALRLASNLQVAQKNARDWGISARGFNTELANKLLVLIDGRSVYTPLFSGVFWGAQDYPLEDIDRIEVISGPGGTLWGANAVNGVINIITKNAAATQGLSVMAGAGNESQSDITARYGGSMSDSTHWRVYGRYADRDATVLNDGASADDGGYMHQGGFRLDTDLSTDSTLTVQGDLYGTGTDVATGGVSKQSGGNLLGRWSAFQSAQAGLSVQFYYDHTHLAQPKPFNGLMPAGVFTDNLDTYDLDFQHYFPIGARQIIVWGLGYRFTDDHVGDAPTLAFVPDSLDHHLASAFVQNKITLLDTLFLTLGTKLEHNSYTGFEYEPSGRLQWNVATNQMLWGALSRAVRTPSRIDSDLREPTGLAAPLPQSILNGSPDFVSETLLAYELGYRAQLNQHLNVSLSTFYNDYDHVRSTTPAPAGFPSFGFPLVFANNLEGHTYGAELSVVYQPLETWRLRGGYNLLKESLHVKTGYVDFSNALNETADPEQQASLRSSWDMPNNVQLDVGLRWVDVLHNNNGPNPGTVPSYFEADMRLGWQPYPQLTLELSGQNLLHNHHPEYGYPNPSRAEIQRSAMARAIWHFAP
jgi:iron complex outermembrane recepter protein